MLSSPGGWSGQDAQRFWPLMCPDLMASSFRPRDSHVARGSLCRGLRHRAAILESGVVNSHRP